MKRFLITGGAGFIGSALIKQLQSENKEIFVLDNLSFGNRRFIDIPDPRFFQVDIRELPDMLRVMEEVQPEVVIHLAAIHFIPYCNQHPFEASDINIRGTMNVIDAIEKVGTVKKVLFASTAAVYPISDNPVAETNQLLPLDIYGLSKLAGERLFNEFYIKTGIPTIICRFFNAFGPNETNPHLIPEIAAQINRGDRVIKLGNLTPKRDFIHTSDMAEALSLLIGKFNKGIDVFNLGRGEEYSVTDIVEYFKRALNQEVMVESDVSRVRKMERMHLLADISKLKAYINWKPRIDPGEGIKTLLNEDE